MNVYDHNWSERSFYCIYLHCTMSSTYSILLDVVTFTLAIELISWFIGVSTQFRSHRAFKVELYYKS